MSLSFEPAMEAAFEQLCMAAAKALTANATSGSAVLANVSSFEGLFAGLPVFGPGVPAGAMIQSLDLAAHTLTLDSLVGADAAGGAFTTGFLTTDRRLQHWNQVSAQPAAYLRRIGTTDEFSGELPITTLECEIWIYSKAGQDPDAIPDEALSNLDQMVRAAFAPDVRGDFVRCTLGGRVFWARIEGRSDYSPGDQGGQGISRIPLRITLDPGL